MLRFVLLPTACLLAACAAPAGGEPPTAAGTPTPIAGALVDVFKVVVATPRDGVVTISGKPGSVYGAPADNLAVTILREGPAPASGAWRLSHLGGGLPIAAGYAIVAADGGFAEVRLGEPAQPVAVGDEVNLTPYLGVAQAGFPAALVVR